ncbi:MAG: transglutaminase domain-containing protein [Chloroflexota bacterium]|nr:MAG: transglutaminase domain-containing protein [Chloroflexota bacterium]
MRRRWLRRLNRRMRRENWLALGLVLAIFVIILLGVASAVSGLEFTLLWPTTLVALALGWGLAAAASGRLAIVLSALLGPPLIIIQVGNLLAPLAAMAVSIFTLVSQAISSGVIPASTSFVSAWNELTAAAGALITRLYDWLLALTGGEPLFDPVATAVLWLLVLWMAAFWAGWCVRRRNQPMLALLPSLILLAVILIITGTSALYLAPALALMLMLKALTSHAKREQSWKADEIEFSQKSSRKVVWTASGLALALMIAVLIIPSPSIYRLADLARNLSQQQRDQELARSLGLEAAPNARAVDAFAYERHGGLPARHLIGSGPELSQQAIMAITVEGPTARASRLRYWRGLTYDRYNGRGWETAGTTTINYEAGEAAGRIVADQQLLRQEVRPLTELGGLLYAAGTLRTVDEAFQVAWRARYLATETYTDFFAAAAADGDTGTYRVDSFVPDLNEAELRAGGRDIPDWIADRYLILPDVVSARVRALARDLTATEPTAYDRAHAIEAYLRQFPYTLDLPAPPTDREIADYFLFELQRGYCDYYATTMVVLARAVGLPARLATGYIGGTYDQENRHYTVTADLAHSWPEIYFPDYGWIQFEPTGGRAAIERPAETRPRVEAEPETELEPITEARRRARWNLVQRVAAAAVIFAAVVTVGWWLADIWRLRFLPPNRAFMQLFERLTRSGRRLDVRPKLGETPHEFAGRLSAQLAMLSGRKSRVGSLASAPEAVYWLTGLYTRGLFSPYEAQAKQHTKAIRTWSRLRVQLLWAALLLRSKKVIRRFQSSH